MKLFAMLIGFTGGLTILSFLIWAYCSFTNAPVYQKDTCVNVCWLSIIATFVLLAFAGKLDDDQDITP